MAKLKFGDTSACPAMYNSSEGEYSTVTAFNRTGSNITAGSKVWLDPTDNSLHNFLNDLMVFQKDYVTINDKVATLDSDYDHNYGYIWPYFYSMSDGFKPLFQHPWEMHFKFTTNNDVTIRQKLNGAWGTDCVFPTVEINTWWGRPLFFIHVPQVENDFPNDWAIRQGGSYTVLPNTTYWLKFGWDGNWYYVEYSLDGVEYNHDIAVERNASCANLRQCNVNLTIGNDYFGSGYCPFLGSIDLKETYIKSGGNIFWMPYIPQVNDRFITGIAGEYIYSNQQGSVYICDVNVQSSIVTPGWGDVKV